MCALPRLQFLTSESGAGATVHMGQICQDKIVNGKIEVDGKSSAGLELWQGYNFMQQNPEPVVRCI